MRFTIGHLFRLERAIQAVRDGMSMLQASEAHSVARTTLARRCKALGVSTSGRTRGPDRKSSRGGPGSRYIDAEGYVVVYQPDHQFPRRGGVVREHVMVMELSLGRRLAADEIIHHRDHDRRNNDLSNLEVMKRGEHSAHHRAEDIHRRQRDEHGRFAGDGR